jgi:hypothetical protein
MKRRHVLQSVLALPAVPAAAAAQSAGASTYAVDAMPKLETQSPEAAGAPVPRFFSPAQYKALAEVCRAVAPGGPSSPSAIDAEVPEFLDFLISESPPDTQALYRQGLDRIARDGAGAGTLASLTQPWTYDPPSDPFARFLRQAKQDILQATFNSRAQAELSSTQRRRGGGGLGYYWRSLD